MTNPLFDLTGKVAVVTGSTRGIGKETATQLARAGAKVVISSRKQDAVSQVVEELKNEGLEAAGICCNVANKGDLQKLVDDTCKLWGQIDILVCNAATNPVYGPSIDLPEDAFDKIMNTNVKSIFLLCNMVLPEMAERKDGAIIIISSIAAVRGSGLLGAYAVSKAAEAQLARNLAVEWGPKNIRINAIAPGLIKTDFAKALWEDPRALKMQESMTPLRRIGEPNDIAGVAVCLAAPAGKYITGQYIVVDGGMTIGGSF
ncbi:MAG TPA: SDR family oxidoreductase [Oculatellaceae cyanobacterium]